MACSVTGNKTIAGKRLSACSAADLRFGMSGSVRVDTLWPGASNSAFNTPIGTSATLSAAGITFIESGTYAGGVATRLRGERERIFMDKTAATATVKFNCYGWGGVSGCTEPDRTHASTGSTYSGAPWFADFTVPMLLSYTVADDGNNNSAAWITADGANVDNAQPLCHSTAGGDVTCQVKSPRTSLRGTDMGGSHYGSGLSALHGTIRYGEITNAINNGLKYLSHGLKCVIDAHRFYYYAHSPGYTYIATQRDGYASPTTYAGVNANLVPGALLTLQSGFNTSVGGGNVTTAVGSILAETIKRFGIIPIDDTTWNAVMISVEDGPAGSVHTELSGLGYTLDYDPPSLAGANAFYKDIKAIFEGLYIVTNATTGALGGGGSAAYGTPTAPGF